MMLQTGRAARNNTSSLNRCCYPRSSLILYSRNSTERSWTLSPSLNSLWHCLYVQSTAQFMKMQFISCRMLSGAGRMQTENRACGGCWIWVLALLLFFLMSLIRKAYYSSPCYQHSSNCCHLPQNQFCTRPLACSGGAVSLGAGARFSCSISPYL